MISGCTNEDNEFKNNCYRVINKNVCHGCCCKQGFQLSDKPWAFCPENKNFECSRKISPKMVIEKLKENNLI